MISDRDRPDSKRGPSGSGRSGDDVLSRECTFVETARAMLSLRRERAKLFDPGLFGEPAWDILLTLYVREGRGESTTATQLQEASGVPPSTADRWTRHLVDEGLVARRSHSALPDTDFLELTDRSKQSLEAYLEKVLRQRAQLVRQSGDPSPNAMF